MCEEGASTVPSSAEEILTFLGSVALFDCLSPDCMARLATACRVSRVGRSHYLFFEGDAAHSVYVVRHGWMVILLAGPDGRELVLSEMRRGDVFGENAVLTGLPRSATAVAREGSELLVLPGEVFLSVLQDEPCLARRLLEQAAARLAAGNQREAALAFLPAEARLARMLHQLDDLDQATRDKGYVTVSQEELAQRTGLTRQTVARLLGQWRRQDWLLTGRGRIMLLNRAEIYAHEEQMLD